jgi:hypothetical protein
MEISVFPYALLDAAYQPFRYLIIKRVQVKDSLSLTFADWLEAGITVGSMSDPFTPRFSPLMMSLKTGGIAVIYSVVVRGIAFPFRLGNYRLNVWE